MLVGILVLGVDIGETGLDRIQLVAADEAIQDLDTPRVGVEFPSRDPS